MKSGTIYFTIFILLIIIFEGILSFYLISENSSFHEEIHSHLIDATQVKVERINNFLKERKADIEILSNSLNVKRILKENLTIDKKAIEENVDCKAKIISKEIENYLKVNNLTLDELKNDEYFKKIVLQPIGKEGYGVIITSVDSIVQIHKFNHFSGYTVFDDKNASKDLIKLITESKIKDTRGYFNWTEKDGKIKQKYGVFKKIPIKTRDGKELIFIATAYVEDYKSPKKIEKIDRDELENFVKINDYDHLFLVSREGRLYFGANYKDFRGTNIFWNSSNLFREVSKSKFFKSNESFRFFGPTKGEEEDDFLYLWTLKKVYSNNELKGYILLVSEMERINEILEKNSGLGKKGEVYLINKNKLLITPLKKANYNLLVQEINTAASNTCLNNKFSNFSKVIHGVNYLGEDVEASIREFKGLGWCMISEIDTKEVKEIPRSIQRNQDTFFLIRLFIILVFTSWIIGRYISKRYVLVKSKRKKFNLRKSKLSFLKKINISQFLFGLFILNLIFIFFINFYSLHFLSKILFFDIGALIFFKGLHLEKNPLKNYIYFGGFLIMLSSVIEIIFENTINFNLISPGIILTFKIFPTVLELISFIILIHGFGGWKK